MVNYKQYDTFFSYSLQFSLIYCLLQNILIKNIKLILLEIDYYDKHTFSSLLLSG